MPIIFSDSVNSDLKFSEIPIQTCGEHKKSCLPYTAIFNQRNLIFMSSISMGLFETSIISTS